MKALLSVVFDMSLTASWVILAVLVIRFLLRKAPRKYAYALWSVVAFRLCCPVSFSSVFSLFSLPLPSPVLRQTETVSQITQTPVQVIPTAPVTPMSPTAPIRPQLPVVTPGLPAVTQPAVTPAADAADLWLTAATAVWCVGMAALLVYAAVSYVRLHRQLSTAIRLEGNVYQAENIRSPFILGFLQPKIYIPYGLDADSLRYVLAHERMHLRRLDHMVKPLSFLLLTVHWFNPLVWLSFFLMSRDMEMSCDEAVLAREDNIRKAYSTTLLSFAANRRFPSPSPLSFGETGIRERIRNVLRWKRPAAWVTVTAVLVCAVVLIACAADPETPADSTPDNAPAQSTAPDISSLPAPAPTPAEGKYLSAQCLYLSPYSSQTYTGDSGYRYKIADWTLVITHRASGEVTALSPEEWGWQDFPWTEVEWNALFSSDPLSSPPNISGYTEKLYQPLGEEYFLLRMDGTVWVVQFSQKLESVWSIYTLKPEETSVLWEYDPYLSSRYPAFGFIFDLPKGWQISAYCTEPRLSLEYGNRHSDLVQRQDFFNQGVPILYWHPGPAKNDTPPGIMQSPSGEIRLHITTPANEMLEATVCIHRNNTDSIHPVYSASITGTALTLSWPEGSLYAVIALGQQSATDAIGEPRFAVEITSNGTKTAPYRCMAYSEQFENGHWLSADGKPLNAKLLAELHDSLPTVTLDRDFRIDYAGEIYGPGSYTLYDRQGQKIENYRDYYGLTFLNWLEQGEYYLTFRVSANGDYISSEDRYESTGWTCIVRLVVPGKLAAPLPVGAKLELVSAELWVSGIPITLTNENLLNRLENTFAKTKPLPGGAGCPFGSTLYLTCADGMVYSLCHAEDSCSAIFSDGQYYRYSGDSNDFWQPFSPRSGDVIWPENSQAAQLQLIADSIDTWAVPFDYADDRVGYAVTDLNGNGRLELITAQQGGTGSYTYSTFYEINDTFTTLEPLLYEFPEGSSQPDIMDEETIALFYGESSGAHTYIFYDWGKASAFEGWTAVWALTFRDGEVDAQPLALRTTVYNDPGEVTTYTDGSGSTITKQEFENIAATAFPQHTQYRAVIHWLLFPRDVSIRSLDADTLLAQLTESCHSSGITEFMN